MVTLKRCLAAVGCLVVLMSGLVSATAGAASKSSGGAGAQETKTSANNATQGGSTSQSVTLGYAADGDVQNGMIVALEPKDPKRISALTTATIEQMLGVAVAASDATVNLSDDTNSGQVFVASFGRYNTLVSTQNGPINAGDYVTISALAGIGMKVDAVQPIVIGRAAASFTGNGSVISTAKLKTSTGGSVTVAIGRIPVDISISHNPLQQSADKNLPSFLQKASEQIAGHPVGVVRAYISLAVLAVACFLAGGVLYSGVRGGLIAIGRNPMAKRRITGGIFRAVLAGLVIFLVGILGVYLLLKL